MSNEKLIKLVLFTTELNIGGVQLKLLRIANGLDKDKFEIHVLSNGQGNLIGEFKKIPGIKIHSLRFFKRRPYFFGDLFSLFHLIKTLFQIKPDIIDYTGPKAALIGSFSSWLLGIPIRIYTMGGITFNHQQSVFVRYLFKSFERFVCFFSTCVVNVCNVNRQKIISSQIVHKDKTRVVYSPSDLRKFIEVGKKEKLAAREKLGWNHNDFIVLQVSNLIPQKNNIALIEIAQKVISQQPQFRFYIVGDGIEKERIQNYIEENKLDANCFLLGWRSDIPELMAGADVVTLTSKYPEGLPQVCAQAMASARPMVMYDWEGIKEELHDGENGYLIQPDDLNHFAECLIRLASDKKMAQMMGQKSFKLLNQEHDEAVMIKKIETLYKSEFEACKKLLLNKVF